MSHGSIAHVRALIEACENVAADLDGPTPAIEPKKASLLLQAYLNAMRAELGIPAPCDCAGCDCRRAVIQSGTSDVLDLLAGGSQSMLHPMDDMGRAAA